MKINTTGYLPYDMFQINLDEPFSSLHFLWIQDQQLNRRLETIDELYEDRLGMLLYVDDSELSPEANQRISKINKETSSLNFGIHLAQNIVGQSLIIGFDRIIKRTSHTVAGGKVGPNIPDIDDALRLSSPTTPTIPWANAVRCASNYVRHVGGWKSKAESIQSQTGNYPSTSDFRPQEKENLDTLIALMDADLKGLIDNDLSYRIAVRLGLCDPRSSVQLFTDWESALT